MIIAHIVRRLLGGMVRGMLRRWPTTFLALGLLIGGGFMLASRGLLPGVPAFSVGAAPGSTSGTLASSDLREMTIESMRTGRSAEQVNLVLKEKRGNRRLEMAAGLSEATAIAAEVDARRTERPTTPTYDLMRSLVQELGGTVESVVVNNVDDTTFYAKVIMTAENRQIEVSSRPSDAIALALRVKVPIFAEASVLDKVGVLGAN